MKVLVTGATGFVGSHLSRFLLKNGYRVAGIARQSRTDGIEDLMAHPSFTMIWTDLCHDWSLPADVNAIVHAAACARPAERSLDRYIDDNVVATRKLLDCAGTHGVRKIIYISAISVFGEIVSPMVDEQTPLVNPSHYGVTKYLGEELLRTRSDRFRGLIIRLPGVLGPGAFDPWLARILRRLVKGDAVTVYNPQALFNNAVHVEDLARFVASVLARDLRGVDLLTFASEKPQPILEVVSRLVRETGSSSEIRIEEKERAAFLISTEKLKTRYGYVPWSLEDVLEKYVQEAVGNCTTGA